MVEDVFPGVTDTGAAIPVTVQSGSEATAIDIPAPTSSGLFKISGAAVNPLARVPSTGQGDRSVATFNLVPRNPGALDGMRGNVANAIPLVARPNNEFEIRNIPSGSYDLFPLYFDAMSGRYYTSPTPVEVGNRDVAGLNISIERGVTVSGDVVVRGAATQSIDLASLTMIFRALDNLPHQFASGIGTVAVDAAGKFSEVDVPRARYTLDVSGLPEPFYIADIRQGTESVYDEGFIVGAQQPSPIQIAIGADGGTVEGRAASGATIVLAPPYSRRRNSALYRQTKGDKSGAFTFKGVPPGTYTIYAWERIAPGAWENEEVMKTYEGLGQTVNVTASSDVRVQLNVIPSN
jgi:hypothetical protein